MSVSVFVEKQELTRYENVTHHKNKTINGFRRKETLGSGSSRTDPDVDSVIINANLNSDPFVICEVRTQHWFCNKERKRLRPEPQTFQPIRNVRRIPANHRTRKRRRRRVAFLVSLNL